MHIRFGKLLFAFFLIFAAFNTSYANVTTSDSCDVYTSAGNVLIPKPFSSTICPNDKAVVSLIKHFPSSMEVAIKLSNLKYKNQLLGEESSVVVDGENTVASQQGQVKNEIINIESSSLSIRSLAVFLITILFSVQMMSMSVIALRSGEVGGKKYGLFKTFTRLAIGIVLITPISVDSTTTQITTTIMVIQAIIGLAILASIAFANIAISTIGYVMASDITLGDSPNDLYQNEEIHGLVNLPSVATRMLLENALCANQLTLLGVYGAAKSDGVGSVSTLSAGGSDFSYTTLGDGSATLAEVALGDKAGDVIVQYGFNLENKEQSPYLCAEVKLFSPIFNIDQAAMQLGYTSDSRDYQNLLGVVDEVDLIVSSMQMESLKNKNNLIDKWATIKGALRELQISDSYVDGFFAEYYFDKLRYIREGGLLSVQDTNTFDLFNKRGELAKTFSDLIVEARCYTGRLDFLNTKNTISSLNGGNIDASDFTLKCAVAKGNKLTTPYSASTSSAEAYMKDVLEVANASKYKADDAYVALYSSFEEYIVPVETAYASVLNQIDRERSILNSEQNGTPDKLSNAIKVLREEGIAVFSYSFVNLSEIISELATLIYLGVGDVEAKLVGNQSVFYSNDSNYLPKVDAESLKDFSNFRTVVPEYVFVTPDDNLSIESAAESQLFTEQGGVYGSSGSRNSTSNDHEGAVYNKLGQLQTVSIDQKIINEQQQSLMNAMEILSPRGVGNAQDYHDIVSACTSSGGEEYVKEKYGDQGLEVMAKSCLSYNEHYLFTNKKDGAMLIEAGVWLLGAGLLGKTLESLQKKRVSNSKDELAKYRKEKTESKEGISGTDSGLVGKNKAAKKADKANSVDQAEQSIIDKISGLVGQKVGSSVLKVVATWLGFILLLIGLMMAVISPLIPIVAHLLSYLGWYMLVCQLMVIGALIALSFFMFLDQDDPNSAPEKATIGIFTNIILRPFAIIVGVVVAYILTYIAFVIIDLSSKNMISGLSEVTSVFTFNPLKYVLDIILQAVVAISYIYLIKTIFEVSMKAPNNIIKKIGAESIDARENKASGMVFAVAAQASDKVVKQFDMQKKKNEEKINQVIKDSNKKDIKTVGSMRDFAADKIESGVGMMAGGVNAAKQQIGKSFNVGMIDEKSQSTDLTTKQSNINDKEQKPKDSNSNSALNGDVQKNKNIKSKPSTGSLEQVNPPNDPDFFK